MGRVKAFMLYSLVALDLVLLATMWLYFGLPGLVMWVVMVGMPQLYLSGRKSTAGKQHKHSTAYVLPSGKVLHRGKVISFVQAKKLRLKLEYAEDEPVKKKKRDYFKVWS